MRAHLVVALADEVDLAFHGRERRRTAALVGNVDRGLLRVAEARLFEQDDRAEVQDGAGPGGAVGDLLRRRFDGVDQILIGLERAVLADGARHRVGLEHAEDRPVERIVGHRAQRRHRRVRADAGKQQRVAIGLGLVDFRRADDAAGAVLVHDHELVRAELGGRRRRERSGSLVGRATGRIGHDQRDRFFRIDRGRGRRAAERERSHRGKKRGATSKHASPLADVAVRACSRSLCLCEGHGRPLRTEAFAGSASRHGTMPVKALPPGDKGSFPSR